MRTGHAPPPGRGKSSLANPRYPITASISRRRASGAKVIPFAPIGRSDMASLIGASLTEDGDEFLQESIDALRIQVAVFDASGKLLIASEAWRSAAEKIASSKRQDAGDDISPLDFLANEDHDARRIAHSLSLILSGELPVAILYLTVKYGQHRDRFRLRMTPLKLGQGRGVLMVNEDLTEVIALNRDKRRLKRQLIHAEDDERRRIAREMHDSTLQDLVAIGLNLQRLKTIANNAITRDVLSDVHSILGRAQRDIRTMTFLLHPPLLEEGGLMTALGALVRGLSARMNIRITLKGDLGAEQVPASIETALYRVAQEALMNVHRHALASRAELRYFRDGDQLVLQVEDDGVGIGGRHSRRIESGVGILGMRARLHELGGTLTLSRLVHGTMLKAIVPYRPCARA